MDDDGIPPKAPVMVGYGKKETLWLQDISKIIAKHTLKHIVNAQYALSKGKSLCILRILRMNKTQV